jgi:hypothetical protein
METQLSSTVVRMAKDPPKLPHSDQLQTTSAGQVCAFLPWNQSASYNVRQLFKIGGACTECWGLSKCLTVFGSYLATLINPEQGQFLA